MRVASIDIGTNTCNLLIAEIDSDKHPLFIHRDKKAISLINNRDYLENNISDESINNLVLVIKKYQIEISNLGVSKTIVTATSGIRSANNRTHVVNTINLHTGLNIEIIDGQREAELVYTGVNKAVNISKKTFLIIDIGGGSIEFIIVKNEEIVFKDSFQIGVARLLNTHKFSDPLIPNDILIIENSLRQNLSELFKLCKNIGINTLVGSSGSYETFADLIKCEFDLSQISTTDASNTIDIDCFEKIHQKLITFDYEKRKNMPGMEIIRVQLIPIASVITNFVINELNIKLLIQSNYSIKEGLIFDYLSKNY